MSLVETVMRLENYRTVAYSDGNEHFFGCRLRQLMPRQLRQLLEDSLGAAHNALLLALPPYGGMTKGMQDAILLAAHYLGLDDFFKQRELINAINKEDLGLVTKALLELPLPPNYLEEARRLIDQG